MSRRLATLVIATAVTLGMIPAVGGYSNTSRPGSTSGDFTTVGIVTQVDGDAFAFQGKTAQGQKISIGSGIGEGHRLWVKEGGLVRIGDTRGGRITVAGPATVEFLKATGKAPKVKVSRGSVLIRSAENTKSVFETTYLMGEVAGDAGVWASEKQTQVMTLSGEVKTWHPDLAAAAVTVPAGYYSEGAAGMKYLHPKKPATVDDEKYEAFVARFEKSDEDEFPELDRILAATLARPGQKAERAPAAEIPLAAEKLGSRVPAQVLEEPSEKANSMLEAHIQGLDYEEEENNGLAVAGKKGRNPASFGQSGQSGGNTPEFEIREKGTHVFDLDDVDRNFLKEISGGH